MCFCCFFCFFSEEGIWESLLWRSQSALNLVGSNDANSTGIDCSSFRGSSQTREAIWESFRFIRSPFREGTALRGTRVGYVQAHVSSDLFHVVLRAGGLLLELLELFKNVLRWTGFEEFFDLCRQANQDEVIQLPCS